MAVSNDTVIDFRCQLETVIDKTSMTVFEPHRHRR